MFLSMAAAMALAAQGGQARPPQRAYGSLNQYFSADDYPETAMARGAEGTVGFRLDIGADGSVTRCAVTHSSNDAALDSATCAIILGRARYRPARDAAGRAIAGKDEGRVTWRLPAEPGRPFVRTRLVSVLGVDGAGGLRCDVTVDGVAQTDVTPNRCGWLSGTGVDYQLRQAPVPAQFTMITVLGPATANIEAVSQDEARLGTLRYDLVTDLDIGRDGRITACRVFRNNYPPETGREAEPPPDPCAYLPPRTSPLFVPSADAALRRARYRIALYLTMEEAGTPPARPGAASPAEPRP